MSDFYTLLGEFLRRPEYLEFVEHIGFDERRERIASSRFLVPVTGVPYGRERQFLDLVPLLPPLLTRPPSRLLPLQVKERLALSVLNATAHHPTFQLGEQQVRERQ